jgi:glycosyltransferase involved in cell wall biosynthesis
MTAPTIAFFAPLKAADHPVASGDRTMANGIMAALSDLGWSIDTVSRLRLLEPCGDLADLQRLDRAAAGEAERYLEAVASHRRPRPAAMLTYHCYYKAPDLVGPRVAGALGIPYLIAEPSSAGKRAAGRHALGHRFAEAAFAVADVLLPMTARDRAAFARRLADPHRLIDLPPFIRQLPASRKAAPLPRADGTVSLLTVAMMRESNKRQSYLKLAEALALVPDAPWRLDIVGDGPARDEIGRAFAGFGPRVTFHGFIGDRGRLARLHHQADLFVWPAVTEAYGMALLEAQAHGLPCLAGRDGGVADVVMDGRTGLLTPASDTAAFAAALRGLIADAGLRETLGTAAAAFVREERSLASARRQLARALAAAGVPGPGSLAA